MAMMMAWHKLLRHSRQVYWASVRRPFYSVNFSTLPETPSGVTSLASLPVTMRSHGAKLDQLLRQGGALITEAKEEDSDDIERRSAITKVRQILERYEYMLKTGEEKQARDLVQELFEKRVNNIKQELLGACEPRFWIGWTGWF